MASAGYSAFTKSVNQQHPMSYLKYKIADCVRLSELGIRQEIECV